MNITAHPKQNIEGAFERPQYGQLYFLDPDNTLYGRKNLSFNHGISPSLIELFEIIIERTMVIYIFL